MTRRRWQRRWWRSSNSNSSNNSSNRRGKKLCRIYLYSSCSCLSKKKKKKKSNQWYQINVRGNRRWCPPSGKEVLMLLHKEKKNGQRRQHKERSYSTNESWHSNYSTDGDTPISMYRFWWPSHHIQYTYNSSHKINLFSLQLKIK